MQCNDGCIVVEKLLQGAETDRLDIIDQNYDKLKQHKCFQEIEDEEYGHINYAVMAYAASSGHLNCIKTLHENTDVMWHTDLAIVAAENNNLDCLQYIIEHMGDVSCGTTDFKDVTSLKCKEYIAKVCKN